MISYKPYYGPDEKRLTQITLAKNISPEAQYELLATVLDQRDIYDVYKVCPKCDIPSGVKILFGIPPDDDEILQAIADGEILVIESRFTDKNRNYDHNYECFNCHHTWLDNSLMEYFSSPETDK